MTYAIQYTTRNKNNISHQIHYTQQKQHKPSNILHTTKTTYAIQYTTRDKMTYAIQYTTRDKMTYAIQYTTHDKNNINHPIYYTQQKQHKSSNTLHATKTT